MIHPVLRTPRWTVVSVALAGCPAAPSVVNHAPRELHVAPGGSDRGSGSEAEPWATLAHAAREARAGDRVLVHDGTYSIDRQIRVRHAGRSDAWISIAAAPGESPILDATSLPTRAPSGRPPFDHDQGVVQLEGVAFVRVQGLTIRNAHRGGIAIRDSHHIAIVGNTTDSTFSSGIAAFDSDRTGERTHDIEIRGNEVARPNAFAMLPPGWPKPRYTPHEGISIEGARAFEVSENHVHHGDKEGIDVKGTSHRGRVHHNHVHDCAHQGLYVDGWFGALRDVELDHNDVHNNRGAGIVVSVEDGPAVENIRIHHNEVYDNLGAGVFFSRWAGDGVRRNIAVESNTIRKNGFGPPKKGRPFYWMTGGIYLFSANVFGLRIVDNVIEDNQAFQIGISQHVAKTEDQLAAELQKRGIEIRGNRVDTKRDAKAPVDVGDAKEDRIGVWPVAGDEPR